MSRNNPVSQISFPSHCCIQAGSRPGLVHVNHRLCGTCVAWRTPPMIISLSCASAGLDTARVFLFHVQLCFLVIVVLLISLVFVIMILLILVVVGGVRLVVGCSLLLFLFFFLLIALVLFLFFCSSYCGLCLLSCFFLVFFCWCYCCWPVDTWRLREVLKWVWGRDYYMSSNHSAGIVILSSFMRLVDCRTIC